MNKEEYTLYEPGQSVIDAPVKNPDADRSKTGWGPFWTPEDDERLFDETPQMSNDELSEYLVHGKGLEAHRLGGKALEIERLRRLGIVNPQWTWERCVYAHIMRSLGASLLFQESGGGHNVYGHDPTIFIGAGLVTAGNYAVYHRERGHTRMQGVGPLQLTWWEFQDSADRLGGCWDVRHNMYEGFVTVHGLIREHGWWSGIERYNGSGPAAVAYANAVTLRQRRFLTYLRHGHF